MVNQSHSTDVADEPYSTPDRTSAPPPYPGMPRWVKLGAIVTVVLIALLVLVMLVSGGEHGPARHIPSGAGLSPPTAAVLFAPP